MGLVSVSNKFPVQRACRLSVLLGGSVAGRLVLVIASMTLGIKMTIETEHDKRCGVYAMP